MRGLKFNNRFSTLLDCISSTMHFRALYNFNRISIITLPLGFRLQLKITGLPAQ